MMPKLYASREQPGTVVRERISDKTVTTPIEESALVIDEFMDVPLSVISTPSEAQLDRLDRALLQSPFWKND